ncbi:MAG TPA: hypothetical protein VHD56_13220 [Tepidisphaeraceae bacterium]|nr:hypothetical protein [Tepidisphaeraceae bacterium]
MSQINPFTSSILQSPQVQRQQAADKDRQLRKAVERSRDSSLDEDQLEHQVESSEELTPIHDAPREQQNFKRSKHRPLTENQDTGEGESHLDLTA